MADIDQEIAALKQETTDKLDAIIDDQSKPQALRKAAFDILHEQSMQELEGAVAEFNAGSKNFVVLIGTLAAAVQKLQQSSGLGAATDIEGLLTRWDELYGDMRADFGLPNNNASTQDALQPPADEASDQPSGTPAPLPTDGTVGVPLNGPKALASTDYASLSDEYVRFYVGAGYRSPADKTAAGRQANIAVANKARYEAVGNPLGIPWWFIAGAHMLESSFSFTTHLHNGDPLSRRTVHVPAGQPESGMPPFTWEQSAADALKSHGLHGQSDWSLSRALYRWERYNGMGYRKRGVPTPYLWSFSTIYTKGKFIRDGKYSGTAISKQCGAATMLKFLQEAGHVALKLDYTGDSETHSPDVVQPPVILPTPNTGFAAFFAENLPNLKHFTADEFLFKGASHATNHLNTDPPKELWPNIIDTARVLDELRETLGKRIELLSVYRSPAYNAAVGGVAGSQHKRFSACDFRVVGPNPGTPEQWAAKLKTMRAAGKFQGGIGIYPTFVHVDTRGWNTNWE